MGKTVTPRRLLRAAGLAAPLGLTGVLAIVTDILVLQAGQVEVPAALAVVVVNATSILYAAVGAVVELRRPGHLIGRLMLVAGPLYGLLALGWTTGAAPVGVISRDAYLIVNWASVWLSWAGVSLIAGWLPLLFPSGSLPSPSWRLPAGVIGAVGTAGVVAGAMRPGNLVPGTPDENPFGMEGWPAVLQPLVDAVPLALIALIVLAVAALVARYRRGDHTTRSQVRWLLAAVAVVALGMTGNVLEAAVRTDDGYFVSALVLTGGLLLMPISIGIAVLRYRLYDIDVIIRRSIVYAVLSVFLAAVYVGAVLFLQLAVTPFTGSDTLAVAVSTLAVVALFQPARRRIAAAVDQRFYRSRYDARGALDSFSATLRDEVGLDAVTRELVGAADRTLRPASVSVWTPSKPNRGN